MSPFGGKQSVHRAGYDTQSGSEDPGDSGTQGHVSKQGVYAAGDSSQEHIATSGSLQAFVAGALSSTSNSSEGCIAEFPQSVAIALRPRASLTC